MHNKADVVAKKAANLQLKVPSIRVHHNELKENSSERFRRKMEQFLYEQQLLEIHEIKSKFF